VHGAWELFPGLLAARGKTALVAELADWAWHSLINRAGSPHKAGLLIDCDDFAHHVANVLLRGEYGPNRPRDIRWPLRCCRH
jgi:hypothetical protein